MTDLVIGPGFQEWIDAHNGTPKSDELYFSAEASTMVAEIADNGQKQNVLLFYNRPTNDVLYVPFVQGAP